MKKKQNYSSNYEDVKSQKFGLSVGLIGANIDQVTLHQVRIQGRACLLVLSGELSQIILIHTGSESSLLWSST